MKLREHPVTLVQKPGKQIIVPDCMSRMYLSDSQADSLTQFEVNIGQLKSTHYVRNNQLSKVREATQKDRVLQKVISVVKQGLGDDTSSDLELQPYKQVLHELSVIDVQRGEDSDPN
jgi:hypothetical protein